MLCLTNYILIPTPLYHQFLIKVHYRKRFHLVDMIFEIHNKIGKGKTISR